MISRSSGASEGAGVDDARRISNLIAAAMSIADSERCTDPLLSEAPKAIAPAHEGESA